MKKLIALTLALIVALSLAACGGSALKDNEDDEDSAPAPVLGGQGAATGGVEEEPPEPPPETRIPPNAIYKLTGEVKHRLVLEEGYFADFTFEIDFVKYEGAYPSGQYSGDVYMTVKVDAEDFIKDMLKGLPAGVASVNFDVEGYGLRNDARIDIVGIQDFEMQGGKWKSSETKDADGTEVTPVIDSYVAETTLTIPYQTKGAAGGQGSTGGGSFQLGDFNLGGSGDGSCWIRLIIEPDAAQGDAFYGEATGSRKVQIFIDSDGVQYSGEGALERTPHTESNEWEQRNRERMGERYGVDETF